MPHGPSPNRAVRRGAREMVKLVLGRDESSTMTNSKAILLMEEDRVMMIVLYCSNRADVLLIFRSA